MVALIPLTISGIYLQLLKLFLTITNSAPFSVQVKHKMRLHLMICFPWKKANNQILKGIGCILEGTIFKEKAQARCVQ